MPSLEITPERIQRLLDIYAASDALAGRYRSDPGLRARMDSGETKEALEQLGIEPIKGVEFRFSVNTEDMFHIVFPLDPHREPADGTLTMAGGGKTAGAVG